MKLTNEELMQIMTDLGLHEGGMENWVMDNAWLRVAQVVQEKERKACEELCNWKTGIQHVDAAIQTCKAAINARGNE